MGKTRIIAETGAGQHGVATATLAPDLDSSASSTWGLSMSHGRAQRLSHEAARCQGRASGVWRQDLEGCDERGLARLGHQCRKHLLLHRHRGGPHPYPAMVRDFQCVIGEETKTQMQAAEGRLPDSLFACIGGGSNAIGLFHPFLDDPSVEITASRPLASALTKSMRPRLPAAGRASCTAIAPIC